MGIFADYVDFGRLHSSIIHSVVRGKGKVFLAIFLDIFRNTMIEYKRARSLKRRESVWPLGKSEIEKWKKAFDEAGRSYESRAGYISYYIKRRLTSKGPN